MSASKKKSDRRATRVNDALRHGAAHARPEDRLSYEIEILTGSSPTALFRPEDVSNPVLTARDVSDVPAEFVADPFMLPDRGGWWMFFEVWNSALGRGEIGLARSVNGRAWEYRGIVLSEPFHLSYPCVFRWGDHHYMIPEAHQTASVRLYRARSFPEGWTLERTLLDGRDYVDPSIFRWGGRWWLFTSTTANDVLHLHGADDLMGAWREHPSSPVVTGDPAIARPGGRVLVTRSSAIRFTQDDREAYGRQLRAFEVTELTATTYRERKLCDNPIAEGTRRAEEWVHHVDAHARDGGWIACVDVLRVGETPEDPAIAAERRDRRALRPRGRSGSATRRYR